MKQMVLWIERVEVIYRYCTTPAVHEDCTKNYWNEVIMDFPTISLQIKSSQVI